MKYLAIILFILLFAACAPLPHRWNPHDYTVKSGDTLYSIAWRYEKDFQQMARINHLSAPYAIYPGQRLRMDTSATVRADKSNKNNITPLASNSARVQKKKKSNKSHSIRVKKNETLYAIALREGYRLKQLAQWNHLSSPYIIYEGQKLRLYPDAHTIHKPVRIKSAPKITIASNLPSANSVINKSELNTPIKQWNWPTKGPVIQTYKKNEPSRKGIAIKGATGQPIKAAAGGTVVYSGNGLINYGNLIIIKHTHSFLSAYAYNQLLLVKEGDFVKQGQTIAKMGNFNSKPLLHFEIRKNGKPVNPLKYLPKS